MGLDRYSFRARLIPALFVALPIPLAIIAWSPENARIWTYGASVIVWGGGAWLLAQLGRDMGKRKEPGLFASWGGKPTVRMLRHKGTRNSVVLARRHAKLKGLMKRALPTPHQEATDPAAADVMYEACGDLLRTRTRDEKKFSLLFTENCSYGMRRNLWGMKPIGIATTLIGISVLIAILLVDPTARIGARFGTIAVVGMVEVLILIGWLVVFTPEWVRGPADAYAERLLEACEQL